jgi:hypothetical protein
MSHESKTTQKAQITYQPPSPWWWSRSPLQRHGFDEPMPPVGGLAHVCSDAASIKVEINLFLLTSMINRSRACPPATMMAETASIVTGGSL